MINTKRPRQISYFTDVETHQVPDGYDRKTRPDVSSNNIHYIIQEHNKLVEVVNKLLTASNIQTIEGE